MKNDANPRETLNKAYALYVKNYKEFGHRKPMKKMPFFAWALTKGIKKTDIN